MGQVTRATIDMIFSHTKRGEHTPLTIHEEQQLAHAWLDFTEAMKALEDLSFACFAGVGLRAPEMEVYNRTFAVLDTLRRKHNAGKAYGGPSGAQTVPGDA